MLSEALREITIAERSAVADRGLLLMLALDPFDAADRGRLAALPPGYEGETLAHPDLRQAFIAEAKYIALNYRPAYLVLGTEVNVAFERDPDGYRAFVDAYREAYGVVRAASPETLVLVSFQYEQLLGLIPWEPPHVPRWELLDDFAGANDLFAITTYPSFAFCGGAQGAAALLLADRRARAGAAGRGLGRLRLGRRPRGAELLDAGGAAPLPPTAPCATPTSWA